MSPEFSILLGGVFCVALVVFHLSFWRLFNWREDLRNLTYLNRAVMQLLNLALTFFFAIVAYISFFHRPELMTTSLGKTLLVLIAVLWLLRAVGQIFFFGLKHPASAAVLAAFIGCSALYAWPALEANGLI